MRFASWLLVVALWLSACGSGGTDPSMDVGGRFGDDIPAKEINEFKPVEKSYCVGRLIDPSFAQYDSQCQAVKGQGECIQMNNPEDGKSFYCALCGLKGTKMVCFMINPS